MSSKMIYQISIKVAIFVLSSKFTPWKVIFIIQPPSSLEFPGPLTPPTPLRFPVGYEYFLEPHNATESYMLE